MFYRILRSPPGYPEDQKFMVSAYETLDIQSHVAPLKTPDGRKMFATLEEARALLPAEARRLPFETDHQFLELWEAVEGAAQK
jgi:hypothetical protein